MTVQTHAELRDSVNSRSIAALLCLIDRNDSFVITSHTRPDGDAIGASLGLMHVLEAMGKTATVCFSDAVPTIFHGLPGVERVRDRVPTETVDVAILLECDSVARSGFCEIPARQTVNIDHHVSGRQFAEFNWIDPQACAVGAMIYELAMAAEVPITPATASCLYTAVLTDTGSFTYPSTDASTFGIAQHLLESGAAAGEIAQAIYFSVPPSKLRLLASALSNMRLEGEVAWSTVSQAEIHGAAASVEDCEGVVNYLIGMAGIRAAVFLREVTPNEQFRLSLRSKGSIDVAAVAERFGGGGHRNASGCTVAGPLQSASGRVVHELHLACRSQQPAAEGL